MVKNKYVVDFFDQLAGRYDEAHNASESALQYVETRRQSIVKRIGEFQNQSIIDLACGTGYYFEYYQSQNDIIGSDVSECMIEICRKKNFYRTLVASYDNIPFPDKIFDVVLNINAFQYSTNPTQVVKEMGRVLKDDGILILTYFSKYNFRNIKLLKKLATDPGSITSYEVRHGWKNIHTMLCQHGFRVKKRFSLNFLPYRSNRQRRNPVLLKLFSIIEDLISPRYLLFCNEVIVYAEKVK